MKTEYREQFIKQTIESLINEPEKWRYNWEFHNRMQSNCSNEEWNGEDDDGTVITDDGIIIEPCYIKPDMKSSGIIKRLLLPIKERSENEVIKLYLK